METRACRHCGGQNELDARFCGDCGRALVDPAPPRGSRTKVALVAGVVGGCVVGIAIAAWWISRQHNNNPIAVAPSIASTTLPQPPPAMPSTAPALAGRTGTIVFSGDPQVFGQVAQRGGASMDSTASSSRDASGKSLNPPLAPGSTLSLFIRQRVGDYQLTSTTVNQALIDGGATDAVQLRYSTPDGGAIDLAIAAWPTAQRATDVVNDVIAKRKSSGAWRVARNETMRDTQGRVTLQRTVVRNEKTGHEEASWARDQISFTAGGPKKDLMQFYQSLSY